MDSIIITNLDKFEETKKRIIAGGSGKLQVVSDFDNTLTSCFGNGQKIVSLISILRNEQYLTPDYGAKAQALYDRYHPIEINPSISLEIKKEKMREWWAMHYDLLARCGLSRNDLARAVNSEKIALRPGAPEFFDLLKTHNVPLVVLSASGLGQDAIAMYLDKYGKLHDNIYIASNSIAWDENGRMIKVNEPIIHSFNKDYTAVKHFPFYENLKKRKNVILLGDSAGDAGMMEFFEYENLIKIGFLDEVLNEEKASFKNAYDAIILNNGPMDYANKLLKELFIG